MARRSIVERLSAGEKLLLDGGTGSELQRRGVDVSKRTADGAIGAWSATANVDAPDAVRAVHEDYLRVGADIITTNSFWSNRTRLARLGEADRMEEYTRVSVELAREAVDESGCDAYVAGSMAPPTGRPVPGNLEVVSDDLAGEFRDQATVLAEAGSDLILLEYVSTVEEATTLVKAAAETGLPVFLGLKHFDADGTMAFGEDTVEAVRAAEGLPVAAVLDMCSPPEEITAVFPRIRRAFDGPIGGVREHRLLGGLQGAQRRHPPVAPHRRRRELARPVRGVRAGLAGRGGADHWGLLRLGSGAHRSAAAAGRVTAGLGEARFIPVPSCSGSLAICPLRRSTGLRLAQAERT